MQEPLLRVWNRQRTTEEGRVDRTTRTPDPPSSARMEKLRTEMWMTVGTVGLTVAGRLFAAEDCQRVSCRESPTDKRVELSICP